MVSCASRPSVGLFVMAGLLSLPATQTQGQTSVDWKAVNEAFGFAGDSLPGDVVRFNMPRADLHVTLAGTEIKPGLALGAWAAFHPVAANDAMVMGDLVLTDEEVAPVMKVLQEGGVEVTALHNHLIGETPRIMYIHMGGHGNPVNLARTIKRAVGLTKTPLPPRAAQSSDPSKFGFDIAAVEQIIGRKGTVSGGVLHFNVPRAEKLTEEGMETPPSMGAGTSLNLQPTGSGRAAIAGDLAMTGKEVEAVLQTLRDGGIETVALHSHALDDVPRLFYAHFWANDDAIKLARALRSALDRTNSSLVIGAAMVASAASETVNFDNAATGQPPAGGRPRRPGVATRSGRSTKTTPLRANRTC